MENFTREILKEILATPISPAKTKYLLPKSDDTEPLVKELLTVTMFDYYCDLTSQKSEQCLFRHIKKAEELLLPILTAVFAHENECSGRASTYDPKSLCTDFFATLPHVRRKIITDVEAAYLGDPAAKNKDLIVATYPGLFAVAVYRLAHSLNNLGVPFLPRLMSEYAHGKTGIDIHPAAEIDEGFFIDHGTGVVVGETTVIGKNVKVYQGVTFGALSTRGGQALAGKKRHPTIGDNVTVYSNATILGGQTLIGSNSTIGANAFITASLPEGSKISFK